MDPLDLLPDDVAVRDPLDECPRDTGSRDPLDEPSGPDVPGTPMPLSEVVVITVFMIAMFSFFILCAVSVPRG